MLPAAPARKLQESPHGIQRKPTTNRRLYVPYLVIPNGTIEFLKWVALILMTGDHINKYLLHEANPLLFAAGRLAMPLFVFVLAFNLARPGALANGVYRRTLNRMLVFGGIAAVPHIALGSLLWHWWPLNVLFTLAVATAMLGLLDQGRFLSATIVAGIGGALIEFWWPALLLAAALWCYVRRPSVSAAVCAVAALAAFTVFNSNWWAFGALPVILAAPFINVQVPRLRWAFYIYYPVHLTVLWVIATFTQ